MAKAPKTPKQTTPAVDPNATAEQAAAVVTEPTEGAPVVEGTADEKGRRVEMLDLNNIGFMENIRELKPAAVGKLSKDIFLHRRQNGGTGLIQAITVYKAKPEEKAKHGRDWTVLVGHTRYAAFDYLATMTAKSRESAEAKEDFRKVFGIVPPVHFSWQFIPAVETEAPKDAWNRDLARWRENMDREGLDPMEEARFIAAAYEHHKAEGKTKRPWDKVAEDLGDTTANLQRKVRLLDVKSPTLLKAFLEEEILSSSDVTLLSNVTDEDLASEQGAKIWADFRSGKITKIALREGLNAVQKARTGSAMGRPAGSGTKEGETAVTGGPSPTTPGATGPAGLAASEVNPDGTAKQPETVSTGGARQPQALDPVGENVRRKLETVVSCPVEGRAGKEKVTYIITVDKGSLPVYLEMLIQNIGKDDTDLPPAQRPAYRQFLGARVKTGQLTAEDTEAMDAGIQPDASADPKLATGDMVLDQDGVAGPAEDMDLTNPDDGDDGDDGEDGEGGEGGE